MPPRAARNTWAETALVGRDALVEELTAAADEAVQGTGAVFLLTGEAGIGKTSVARAATLVVRSELAVSWGKCNADGAAPPFWPWRALVSAPVNPGPVGLDTGDGEIGAERFERLNTLRGQLIERARAAPLLHVIEDLQWADVASVLLLAQVAAEVIDAPLLVVGTFRTGESISPQLEETMEEVRTSAHVRAVPPLGGDDIGVLMRGAGHSGASELVELVRTRTGGNPLFVTELLRAAPASDSAERLREVVTGTVPNRVSELVAHRLARLPTAVAETVAIASVIGIEGGATTLATASAASVEVVLDLLEQARAARLLDAASPQRWRFHHDLVRDAVYRSVVSGTRARHHASVLEALAADASTPPSALAHHALAALPLFDADRAVALAAQAGEWAFAQHAYEEAVAWFERALAAAPVSTSARWRAELLVLCGESHRQIGQMERARRAFVVASELTDEPALVARAALGYADPGTDLGIAYRTDDPTTVAVLERALAAQPTHDALGTVLLEARLAAVLYFSDDPIRARQLATSAVARAERLGDARALGVASALTHDAFVVGQAPLDEQLQGSQRLVELARQTGSAAAMLAAHRARVFDLLAAGDIAAVDAEVVAFRRIAEPLRVPGYVWWPSLWSAMRALLEGRHEVAEERAMEAFALGEGPFLSLAFGNLSFLLFFLRREQGRFAEMEAATRDYVASHADIPAIRVALIFLLAEIGRTDEAAEMLTGIDDPALARLHDRNWPASWFQLARAASLVGDRRVAALLLEDRHRPTERCVMVSIATACLGSTDLAEAWLRHALGDVDAADGRYASAATVNARIGARSWLAQTRVDHARLLLERDSVGDRDAARRLTDLAAEAAGDIGLGSVAEAIAHVRDRLGREVVPAPLVGTTTSTFRRGAAGWQLDFGGRTAEVADSRGLRDIAHLLARPGEAVSVLELADSPDAATSRTRGSDAFDDRAKRQIRDRLHELDAEVDEAEANGEGERAALAREQRQVLAETVARDLGLGGKSRRVGDPIERVRKTVSTRIRRAIALVGRAHPELGRHLERSIDTGTWCAYRPAQPVDWIF